MKKSLVVLLIAVLALSAVFAADVAITATGDVAASYVVDFDNMTGTYNVPELDGELEWAVDFSHEVNGSKYPYISVAGEIEVDFTDDAAFVGGVLDFTPEVDFTTFEIVGEDWKIDFLADVTSLDYAVSAIDTTEYAPMNKYGKQTGRYVSADLTYRWLTEAEYVVDAVSISKDGIGTITFAANNTNKAAENDAAPVTTYSLVNLDKETVAKMNGKNYKFTTYKAGAKTVVKYEPLDLATEAGIAKAINLVYNNVKAKTVEGKSIYALNEAIKYANGCLEDSKLAATEGDIPSAVGYYLCTTTVTSGYEYEAHNFAVTAETEEIKLSDSITTQFGAGYANLFASTDDQDEVKSSKFGFSAKAAYEDILSVAYDCGYDFLGNEFSFDLTSAFKYEMVAVDVYLAKGQLSYYNAEDLYKLKNYVYYTKDAYRSAILLSAKASVEVEEIGTTFTFTGKDLLDDAYLSYEAVNTYFDNYVFTFDASANVEDGIDEAVFGFLAEADYTEEVGVTAYAGITAYQSLRTQNTFYPVFITGIAYEKDGFSFSVDFSSMKELLRAPNQSLFAAYTAAGLSDNDMKNIAFTVKAGYEAEMFTLSSAVEYNTHETSAYKAVRAWSLNPGLYVSAGIESDKLVDGATLSLDYASAELLSGVKTATGKTQYGTLTAAVTVEF